MMFFWRSEPWVQCHASITLSAVLNEQINIEIPRLQTSPINLIPKIYNEHDTPVAAVHMQLRGQLDCDLMLIFEAEEAKKIVALMASDAEAGTFGTEMAKSALEELGSLTLGSFLSTIADFTDTELVPTPPISFYDSFGAIIDNLLIKKAICNDTATIFDTNFKRSSGYAKGYLIVFLGNNLKQVLTQKGKAWL